MIVSCTQCENAIAIEDERIPPAGMRIRCGRCGEPLVVRGSEATEELGPLRPPPSETTADPFPFEPTPLPTGGRERSGRQPLAAVPPLLEPSPIPPPPPQATGSLFGAPGSWGEGEGTTEVQLPPQERTLVERTGPRALPVTRRFDPWQGPLPIAAWLAGPAVAALAALLVWTAWSWFAGKEAAALQLVPREVEARFFTDLQGRQAAFVVGRVQVNAPVPPGAAIRLRGELVDGSGAVRAEAEGWAGALPPAGSVVQFASKRSAWNAWLREASLQTPPVEAGTVPFFLLFHQLPEESGSLRARIVAETVTAPTGWARDSAFE